MSIIQRLFSCARNGELIPLLAKLIHHANFSVDRKRTFLREETGNKTLQIQAIGLSLYEPLEGTKAEQIGQEVIRTQWLYVRNCVCTSHS